MHVGIDSLIQRVLLLSAIIHGNRAHISPSLFLKSIQAALNLMIIDHDLDPGLIIANHGLPGGLLALPAAIPLLS